MAARPKTSSTPSIYNERRYHTTRKIDIEDDKNSVKECETMASPLNSASVPLPNSSVVNKNVPTVDLEDIKESEQRLIRKNYRKSLNLQIAETAKSFGHKPSPKKPRRDSDKMTTYTTPLKKSGPKSTFSSASKFKEPKISKACMSVCEPFRRTQTRISGTIRDNFSVQSTWEDAMDEHFEFIPQMIKEKEKRKRENLDKRQFLTEVLDEMDSIVASNNLVQKEVDKIQEQNQTLNQENKAIEDELNSIKGLLKQEQSAFDKAKGKLTDELVNSRYAVDKLQRELEDSRDEWMSTLAYQRHEQLEVLESELTEAEEVLMSLEHQTRNCMLRMNKQIRRLNEKNLSINKMMKHQQKVP